MPSETVSPTLTLTSWTTPSIGEGTSIVALSDSSVTSGSSAATVSPGATRISMIGTSVKSPMSGTRTSDAAVAVLMRSSPQTRSGAGRSGSMPYVSIAFCTAAGSSSPPSASAFSAATAT